MNNRERMLASALDTFNRYGVSGVSLRSIATAAGVSFGNFTYHFKSKEDLIRPLYRAMMEAHSAVSNAFSAQPNLLKAVLEAPRQTFEITLRYRFLFTGYAELMRDYPDFAAEVTAHQREAQERIRPLFSALQQAGWLRPEFTDTDFTFIMEASGLLRTHFFARGFQVDEPIDQLRIRYVAFVNALIYPYLTPEGQAIHCQFHS